MNEEEEEEEEEVEEDNVDDDKASFDDAAVDALWEASNRASAQAITSRRTVSCLSTNL